MRGSVSAAVLIAALCGAARGEVALTWQDCVRLASRQNPDLRSALRAMEASRAQYLESYNGILPQFTFTNSYLDSSTTRSAPLTNGSSVVTTSRSSLWQAQGTASLDLIDVGQWASIQTAAASWRQAQQNSLLASSNVLLSLYRAFSALLVSQEEIIVATHIRDLWVTNAEMVDLRYQSGRESKGNNMQTQAQRLQSEMALKQAGRDVRVAQQQLAQAIGQDQFSMLVATGSFSMGTPPPQPSDLDIIVDRLPSVLAQQAVVARSRAAVGQARSTLFPTVSLNYSRGTTDTSEFPTTNPYWAFTGVMSVPLFGGGPTATYFATAAANRTYEQSQEDLRSIRLQARQTLESAWSGFVQAEEQVQVQRALLEAATQRKEESDVRYQAGLMTYQDWQLVNNDYVNFQRSYLSAEQSLLSAEGQWRFATGAQLIGEQK